MRKSDLIEKLVQRFPTRTRRQVKTAVDTILDEVTQRLVDGGRCELRNFGVFSTHVWEGKIGRNPKTGKHVYVSARRVVHFKPGKRLRGWGMERQ